MSDRDLETISPLGQAVMAVEEIKHLYLAVERFLCLAYYKGSPVPETLCAQALGLARQIEKFNEENRNV
jgi:hypothetical protein